jgi:hypothetical protein
MGGFGSGREGGPPTIGSTDAFVLTIKDLGVLRPGTSKRLIVPFSGRRGRPMTATLDLTLNASAGTIVFQHETRKAQLEPTPYVVRLTTTTPTYGGLRWWFLCPWTGRRAHKLFLPRGGCEFWSREGHGLGYAVRSLDKYARRQRRCAKLLAKLGAPDEPWSAPVPDRPFRMRWETYGRLGRELMAAQHDAFLLFTTNASVRRLITRP